MARAPGMAVGKKGKSGRVKREEYEARIDRAEELIVENTTGGAVVAIMRSEFGIQERAAWRYMAAARARWASESSDETAQREAKRSNMRRTLHHVKMRAFRSGEMRDVLGATKQLRNLDGLDVPRELRLSGIVGVADITSELASRSSEDLIAFLRTGRLPSAEETTEQKA